MTQDLNLRSVSEEINNRRLAAEALSQRIVLLKEIWENMLKTERESISNSARGRVQLPVEESPLKTVEKLSGLIDMLEKTFQAPLVEEARAELEKVIRNYEIKLREKIRNEIYDKIGKMIAQDLRGLRDVLADINQKSSDVERRVAQCIKEDIEEKPSTLLDSRELQTQLEQWRLRDEKLCKFQNKMSVTSWFPEELRDILVSSSSILRENQFRDNLDSIVEASQKIQTDQVHLDEDWGIKVGALLRKDLVTQKSLSGVKSVMVSFSEKIDKIVELLRELEAFRLLLQTTSEDVGDKDLATIFIELRGTVDSDNVDDLHNTLSLFPNRFDVWVKAKTRLLEDVDTRLRRLFDDFENILINSQISRDKIPLYEPYLFRTAPLEGLARLREYLELEHCAIARLSDEEVLSPQSLRVWKQLVTQEGTLRLTSEIVESVKELSNYLPLEVRRAELE